jgi:hypothetical protein
VCLLVFIALLLTRMGAPVRWDPNREDAVFFDQSVALYCCYYYVQIMIHRAFIPMLHPAPTVRFVCLSLMAVTANANTYVWWQALPSLTICTTAARACANVVDVQWQRHGDTARPLNLVRIESSVG